MKTKPINNFRVPRGDKAVTLYMLSVRLSLKANGHERMTNQCALLQRQSETERMTELSRLWMKFVRMITTYLARLDGCNKPTSCRHWRANSKSKLLESDGGTPNIFSTSTDVYELSSTISDRQISCLFFFHFFFSSSFLVKRHTSINVIFRSDTDRIDSVRTGPEATRYCST